MNVNIPSEAVTPTGISHSFTPPGERADVCVLTVTYNSADYLEDFLRSLRGETQASSIRVVVADNGSTDGTLEILQRQRDVELIRCEGNLGYAGGINAVWEHTGEAPAILILNPDVRVAPGSVSTMLAALGKRGVHAVVPLIRDFEGDVHPSLRREPSLSGIYGDALFGHRFSSRPGLLSETDFRPTSYSQGHFVDWATGAALMLKTEMAQTVGRWDEQFFLYSEEVDYFRRIRTSGGRIWFEPGACVWHKLGGSGTSAELTALMAVNRVRYVRKYHGAPYTAVFRCGVVLSELLRSYQPNHRPALRAILSKKTWSRLPGAPGATAGAPAGGPAPSGSIIIPAHNEENVIARCLASLAPIIASGGVDIHVVCNGCTDRTAEIARGYPGVNVVEIETASKIAALNAGDAAAAQWPRIYLDADIELPPEAVRAIFHTLKRSNSALAARPGFHYDAEDASLPVRSYYRARSRISSLKETLWGASVIAMTEAGRARFDEWPDITADDLFAHRLFDRAEWIVVPDAHVHPRTPRTSRGLLMILRRHYRGSVALDPGTQTAPQTFRGLLATVRGPFSLADAVVYAAFAGLSRLQSKRRSAHVWERDDSSRATAS